MDEQALRREQAATRARVTALGDDLARLVAASGDANADDEHDPEGATVAYERAQLAALLASANIRLGELGAALDRVADGSYGRCLGCGAPIGTERLAARPAAATCVRCASRPG